MNQTNCISLEERDVSPKGLQKTELNHEKLQSYFFDDDFDRLKLLTKINLKTNSKPTLFYPGCGADIFFPLLYVEKLFPNLQQIKFIFVDTQESFNLILTQLDDVNVSFERTNTTCTFYWKNMMVTLEFILADAFTVELPAFDIYFERAFRIMKSEHPDYEQRIYAALNPNGILISDSGFQFIQNTIKVPRELSGYGEMIVAVKPGS